MWGKLIAHQEETKWVQEKLTNYPILFLVLKKKKQRAQVLK